MNTEGWGLQHNDVHSEIRAQGLACHAGHNLALHDAKSSPPSPAMLATAHVAWPWTLTTCVAHCRKCALQNRNIGEHETRRLARMTYNLPVGRERHADVSAKLEICFAKLSG